MSLSLTNIPRIMRARGWTRGATLMEKWFSRAAAVCPSYTSPDTTTIKMDWVLSYGEVKAVYEAIFRDKIWANGPARGVLARRLVSWGMITGFPHQFDQTEKPVSTLEDEYINYRTYGGGDSGGSGYSGSSSPSGYSSSDTSVNAFNVSSGLSFGGLNDLIAALGAFTFRVVIAGSVTPVLPRGHEVTVTKVGIFVRDSYDFEGFQFLGFWNDVNNAVSAINPGAGTAVFNSSFRDYRTTHHMGGDFLVFSDLKVTTLDPPHKFML